MDSPPIEKLKNITLYLYKNICFKYKKQFRCCYLTCYVKHLKLKCNFFYYKFGEVLHEVLKENLGMERKL